MAKKKQTCPYCGLKFVNLARHKCELSGEFEEDEESEPKLKKKTSSRKSSSPSNYHIKSSRKMPSAKSKSINQLKSESISSKSKKKPAVKRKSYAEIDKEVFELIKQSKEIYFEDILKKLEIDEKILEKSISRLSTKQKIKISSDIKNGLRKEVLSYIEEYENLTKPEQKIDKTDPIKWDTLGDCPCFLCSEINRCNTGQNEVNPIICEYLIKWMNYCLLGKQYTSPFRGVIEDKKKKDQIVKEKF